MWSQNWGEMAWAAITLPHSFTNGAVADADEVTANFTELVSTDRGRSNRAVRQRPRLSRVMS